MTGYANHPDEEVAAAFRRLQNALVCWERATGRTSILIFRENASRPGEIAKSLCCIRLQDGITLDPANADLSDAHLLARFAETHGVR